MFGITKNKNSTAPASFFDEEFIANLYPALQQLREMGPVVPLQKVLGRKMVSLVFANRDAQQFLQADTMDIARKANRHIAFGQRIHYCLGAPLARLEGEIAFSTLLSRMPDIHLDIDRNAVQWRGGMSLRGLVSLPVTFTPVQATPETPPLSF
jgi:cytochrome P450